MSEKANEPCKAASLAKEGEGLAGLAGSQPHSVSERDQRGRFLTGNSGGGRPKGSRNRLTELFLDAISDDFREHGATMLADLRTTDPVSYLRMVCMLLPKKLVLERESEPTFDYDALTLEDVTQLVEAERKKQFILRALTAARSV